MSVFFPDEGLSSVYAALMAFGELHIQNELYFPKAGRRETTLITVVNLKILGQILLLLLLRFIFFW